MPDAADFGDAGSDTLGHVAASRPLRIPTLVGLGLANIRPLENLNPPAQPAGAYGKAAIASPGQDTTTGHWEMAGLFLKHPFQPIRTVFRAS
jgi:phosphopentomutase